MELAIVSDTHMPRGDRRLPDACVARLRAADAILHAGDLMTVEVLELLEALRAYLDQFWSKTLAAYKAVVEQSDAEENP